MFSLYSFLFVLSIFQPKDWNNLQRIGDSNKILDQSKIGKFGLGFNSCYHFSDVWSAASQSTIVFQDPRALQSRKFDFSDPDSTKKNEIALKIQSLQDQFLPLQLGENFGSFSPDKKFNGTLFRFSIRTKDVFEKSAIKQQPMISLKFAHSCKNSSRKST